MERNGRAGRNVSAHEFALVTNVKRDNRIGYGPLKRLRHLTNALQTAICRRYVPTVSLPSRWIFLLTRRPLCRRLSGLIVPLAKNDATGSSARRQLLRENFRFSRSTPLYGESIEKRKRGDCKPVPVSYSCPRAGGIILKETAELEDLL